MFFFNLYSFVKFVATICNSQLIPNFVVWK